MSDDNESFCERHQTAVYWEPTGLDNYGKPTFADPVELSPDDDNNGVRWEQCRQVYVDKQGREMVSRAVVYVGQDLKETGFLWLGNLADIGGLGDPFSNDDVWQIQKFEKIPSLTKPIKYVRSAVL